MNILSDGPCVSICCEQGNTFHHPGARCYWNVSFSSEETVFPNVFDPTWAWTLNPNDLLPRNKISCPNNAVCYSDCMSGNNISTYLFENNMISMNDSIDGGLTCRLDAEDYCFKSYATDEMTNITFACKTFLDLITNMKLSSEEVSYAYVARSLYLYVMSISLPFLVATFIVYTIIPKLNNLHGLLLRSYISSCFVYFLILLIFASDFQWTLNTFMMILFHFALLGTYFWLNVMCFDIWWSFRLLLESSTQSSRQKYIYYSIYAWGIPLLLIGCYLSLGFNPEIMETVNDKQMWLVYLKALPPTIVVVSNICFFVLTIINIIRQKKSMAQCVDRSGNQRLSEHKRRSVRLTTGFYLDTLSSSRFDVYLKLFILMGMSFIAQMLPFFVQLPIHKYMLFILALPNFTQGPIVFMLFVWNDRTRGLMTEYLKKNDWVAIKWMESAVVRIRTLLRRPQTS